MTCESRHDYTGSAHECTLCGCPRWYDPLQSRLDHEAALEAERLDGRRYRALFDSATDEEIRILSGLVKAMRSVQRPFTGEGAAGELHRARTLALDAVREIHDGSDARAPWFEGTKAAWHIALALDALAGGKCAEGGER